MSNHQQVAPEAGRARGAIRSWLVELLPLLWVLGFALKEFVDVNRYIVTTWYWVEDLSRAEGVRLADHGATVALLLILAAFFFLIRRTWRYGLLVFISVVCSVVIIVDSLHASYFSVLPSVAETVEMRQLLEVTKSIGDLFSPYYLVLFLDSFILMSLWPLYLRACRKSDPVSFRSRSVSALLVVLVSLLILLPTAFRARETQAFANADRLRQFGATVGVLPYHATDLLATAAAEIEVTEKAYERVRGFFEKRRTGHSAASPLFGAAKGKSLILISAESLMAYMVGLEVDGVPVMPRFTRFLEESIYFSNFHEQAWLGNTSDGEFLAMQSLYPLPMGPVASHYNGNRFSGLAEVLANAGYQTLSAVGAPAWLWKMETMHRALGFQRSYFKSTFTGDDRIYNWITDKDVFEQSVDRVAELPRPFMVYVLTTSNHHPYDIPAEFRAFPTGKYTGSRIGHYLQSTHYFDTAFGALLDRLEAVGLLDEVVIALYSDHQAYLGDAAAHLPELLGYTSKDHYRRLRSRKLLPFAIRLPGGRHAGVNPTFAGQIDVMPTLLSLLGVAAGPEMMLGRDLTADGEPLVIFRDGSFTDGEVYLINRYGPIANASCFAVRTERPVDCTPLAEKRRQAQDQLEVSDLIIRGDLIPRLEADLSGSGSSAAVSK